MDTRALEEANSQQHSEPQEQLPPRSPLPLSLLLALLQTLFSPSLLAFPPLFQGCSLQTSTSLSPCPAPSSSLSSAPSLVPSFLLLSLSYPPSLFLLPSPLMPTFLPPCRASATAGCGWCREPSLGPSPGALRLCSTPRRVGPT